jgi:mono/diheme cytochrome c family protein
MLTSRAMKWTVAAVVLCTPALLAQTSPDPTLQAIATMKQLMLDVIHPASNSVLLAINRGGPADDREWTEARRGAMTLAESGNLLIMRNRAAAWVAAAKLMMDAGAAAYKAADAKDVRALTAVADRIDTSCTTCHKQYRPGVFPAAR